jgi:hypothetical protein
VAFLYGITGHKRPCTVLHFADPYHLHNDCEADVKSMISAGLSAVSLCGLDLQRVYNGYQKIRILCIGLGGGSLPLFLAHNLPGML